MPTHETATLTDLGAMVKEIAGLAVLVEQEAAEANPAEVGWSPQHQSVTWHQNEYWVCNMPLYGLTPCPVCDRELGSGYVSIAGGPDGEAQVSFETIHVLTEHGHDLNEADPEWKQGLLQEARRLRSTLGV
jgi:hypothetical protein